MNTTLIHTLHPCTYYIGMLKKAWIPSDKYKEILAEKSKSKAFDTRYLRTTVEDVIVEKRKRKKKTSFVKKMHAEWDDLAGEEALYRKFKKGKMSQAEYDEKLLSGRTGGEDEIGERGGGGDSSDMESEDDLPSRKKMKQMMQQQQQAVGKGKKVDYRKKARKF
ncbi:hypothetical protein EON63_16535 [archaeon]|nr:MAG: hypothetical protein EON63_16535 [archaeon]